ncbi:MAG: hypothetical protein ACRD13_04375 [Terriglobales bacterium]
MKKNRRSRRGQSKGGQTSPPGCHQVTRTGYFFFFVAVFFAAFLAGFFVAFAMSYSPMNKIRGGQVRARD